MVNLADGEYELVPADSRFNQEVNLNYANLSQGLGQAPEVFLPDSAKMVIGCVVVILRWCSQK